MTLFVGESAPHSGKFFYFGNTAMTRYMEAAVNSALGVDEHTAFLDRFQTLGWYLDDLVLSPVNHLTPSERQTQCKAALKSLAERIADYRPLAIVSLMRRAGEGPWTRSWGYAPRLTMAVASQEVQLHRAEIRP
jgi:hypothetical protein